MTEWFVPCSGDLCSLYRRGHLIHSIQARKIGEAPWGWRDAVVTARDGLVLSLEYVHEDGGPTVWHHRSLDGAVEIGTPVRLHEQYGALGCPGGWFCVAIRDGLGKVEVPSRPWEWATSPGVVDLSTGVAIATDHVDDQSS